MIGPTLRRRTSGFLLALVLAMGGVGAPWAARTAAAADASIVFAAVDILKQQHHAAPDPVRLLAAAAEGLRQALSQAGIVTPPAALLAGGEAAAREEFQRYFDRAAVLAYGRLSEVQLQYAAAAAAAASLDDSHTAFLLPEQWAEVQRELSNQASFIGIGIRLINRGGQFYVMNVFPGTPAARAGLRDLDRVVAVDGRTTEGMALQEVSRRIRGPQGMPVEVVVRRPGEPAPLVFTISREPILVPAVDARMVEGQTGYVHLHHLASGATVQFRRALQDLQARGMRALVLDLRGNGGGLVGETVSVASALLPPGLPVMHRENRLRRIADRTRGGPLLSTALPLVVLVDEATASGGEVVAAAMREHRRAPLVGVRTAGALMASLYFPLPGGTAIEVAVERVTTGKGTVVEKVGLAPDVQVELTPDDLERGVDAQLERALEELRQRVRAPALTPAA
jgi:carboxyl-terminal processing protease